MRDWLALLPHRPPMRLVAEVVEVDPGVRAVCRRPTEAGDWFFDGHFPGEPVVPAIVLVELLAQAGGLAKSSRSCRRQMAGGSPTRWLADISLVAHASPRRPIPSRP